MQFNTSIFESGSTPESKKILIKIEHIALEVITILASASLEFFNHNVVPSQKPDKSLVSEADQSLEMMCRKLLKERTPQLGFLGEEFGTLSSLDENNPHNTLILNKDTYWVLDPIDGTTNFLSKSPLWTTLLALVHKGKPILGVVSLPCLGEVFIASEGNGARFKKTADAKWQNCYVIQNSELKSAHISTTNAHACGARGYEEWLFDLIASSREFRTHSDAYGYTRVLCGGIDAMVDVILAPYDIAAIQVLFQETPHAWLSTLHGNTSENLWQMGSAIGACSTQLGQEILKHYQNHITKQNSKHISETKQKIARSFPSLIQDVTKFNDNKNTTQIWFRAIESAVAQFVSTHKNISIEEFGMSVDFIEQRFFEPYKSEIQNTTPHQQVNMFWTACLASHGQIWTKKPYAYQDFFNEMNNFENVKNSAIHLLEILYNHKPTKDCILETFSHQEHLSFREHIIGHYSELPWFENSMNQHLVKDKKHSKINTILEINYKVTFINTLQIFLDGSNHSFSRTKIDWSYQPKVQAQQSATIPKEFWINGQDLLQICSNNLFAPHKTQDLSIPEYLSFGVHGQQDEYGPIPIDKEGTPAKKNPWQSDSPKIDRLSRLQAYRQDKSPSGEGSPYAQPHTYLQISRQCPWNIKTMSAESADPLTQITEFLQNTPPSDQKHTVLWDMHKNAFGLVLKSNKTSWDILTSFHISISMKDLLRNIQMAVQFNTVLSSEINGYNAHEFWLYVSMR